MKIFMKKFGADILTVLGIFILVIGIFSFKSKAHGPTTYYEYPSSTVLQIAFGASLIATGILTKKRLGRGS